jgi:hypothetical protein
MGEEKKKRGNPNWVKKAERKKRVPLGNPRAKLQIDGYDIPNNKVARWVNDHPGRLAAAEAAGYAFIEDSAVSVGEGPGDQRDNLSAKVCRNVGVKEDGSPLKAYLMVIDKDLYDEDQREKQRQIDEIDEAIKGGNIQGEVGVDGRYIPAEGIKIDSNY